MVDMSGLIVVGCIAGYVATLAALYAVIRLAVTHAIKKG